MIPMHGRNSKPALNSKTVSKIYTVHSYYNTGLRVVGLFIVGLRVVGFFVFVGLRVVGLLVDGRFD